MESLANWLEQVAEYTGRVVSWATLLMAGITFLVVILRYAFDLGWIAMQESVTYLHATVFMLGAAYTLKHHGHVRVDIFYQKMNPGSRAWVDLLGTLLLLFPVCGFIFWISWDYVSNSWDVLEGSREAGGLPGVFLLKSLILLLPLTLALQGVAALLRNFMLVRNRPRVSGKDD